MALDPMNRLCKWRTVLAGWHTGTKSLRTPSGTPEPGVQAMRDFMDKWLITRVESNALAGLMIAKGVFTAEEFTLACYQEAVHLDAQLQRQFPGFVTSDDGVTIYDMKLARKTMHDLGFPA